MDSGFERVMGSFDKMFKEDSKRYDQSSGLMGHIICSGGCGKTVLKFPEKTLLRHPGGAVIYCIECASKLRLPLFTKIKNWWESR